MYGGSSTTDAKTTMGDLMQFANTLISDKQVWKRMTPSQIHFMTILCRVSPSLPLPLAVKACQQSVQSMTNKKVDTSIPLVSFLQTNKRAQRVFKMFLDDMPVRAMTGGADEDENLCEICYMSFQATPELPLATQLSCTHNPNYHAACLQAWFNAKTTRRCECPKCKKACTGVRGMEQARTRELERELGLPPQEERLRQLFAELDADIARQNAIRRAEQARQAAAAREGTLIAAREFDDKVIQYLFLIIMILTAFTTMT